MGGGGGWGFSVGEIHLPHFKGEMKVQTEGSEASGGRIKGSLNPTKTGKEGGGTKKALKEIGGIQKKKKKRRD